LYEMIDSGDIATVHIGRRRLVTDAALCDYVDRLARPS
jgi:hypothetical protein